MEVNSTNARRITGNESQSAPNSTLSPDELITIDVGSNALAIDLIVECAVMCLTSMSNVLGNSVLLVVFLTTSALRTKTNRILTSLIVSDLITGFTTWFTIAYLLAGYVLGDPCSQFWVITVLMPLGRITPTTAAFHMIVIAIDRYVAICYPLMYEQKMTDSVINLFIAGAWTAGVLMSGSFYLWLVKFPAVHCSDIVPLSFYFIDTALVTSVWIVLVVVYGRITFIAWKHHIRIESHSTYPPIAGAAKTTSQAPDSFSDSQQADVSGGNNSTAATATTGTTTRAADPNMDVKRQFKAVRLTASVVGVYVVLTAPYQVVSALRSNGIWSKTIQYSLAVTSGLVMVYFGFNWMVYGLASSTVRGAFQRVMRSFNCSKIFAKSQPAIPATVGAVLSSDAAK